jgi:hypothetical protein
LPLVQVFPEANANSPLIFNAGSISGIEPVFLNVTDFAGLAGPSSDSRS